MYYFASLIAAENLLPYFPRGKSWQYFLAFRLGTVNRSQIVPPEFQTVMLDPVIPFFAFPLV